MTKVKICGITRLEDALKAKKLGAWAIGQVFAESPRQISIEKAANINYKVGNGIAKVGVFVNEPITNVKMIVKECKLDFVQLHGNEDRDYVKELNVPVIKVFSVNKKITKKDLKEWSVFAFLFDTYKVDIRGGTGETFDLNLIKDIMGFYKVIIAGGLNPNNVSSVIKNIKPFAVDVSSGVESYQGIKDYVKVEQFLYVVKEVLSK